MNQPESGNPVRTAIEISIYLLLIFGLILWCFWIISPFISLLLWAAVIAVSAYKPFLALRAALGGRNRLATAVFVIVGLGIVILPAWMFAGSLIESGQELKARVEAGQFQIPPPAESVKDWPIAGAKLYAGWSEAADDFEGWLEKHSEQVKTVSSNLVGKLAAVGLSVLQFIAATLIAAAMLANAESARTASLNFWRRLVDDRAESMLTLTTATIRSVAVGVLGIAFIQAVLGGAGMLAVGVPAAGIWALFILILAIAQLPPWLVLLPVVAYVFSTHDSTVVATIFAVWSLLVSVADTALKPLLLGRGVEAPMLVILLGAIGGLIYSGIIGLFIGAVVLALGYKLLLAWLALGANPNLRDKQEAPEAP